MYIQIPTSHNSSTTKYAKSSWHICVIIEVESTNVFPAKISSLISSTANSLHREKRRMSRSIFNVYCGHTIGWWSWEKQSVPFTRNRLHGSFARVPLTQLSARQAFHICTDLDTSCCIQRVYLDIRQTLCYYYLREYPCYCGFQACELVLPFTDLSHSTCLRYAHLLLFLCTCYLMENPHRKLTLYPSAHVSRISNRNILTLSELVKSNYRLLVDVMWLICESCSKWRHKMPW